MAASQVKATRKRSTSAAATAKDLRRLALEDVTVGELEALIADSYRLVAARGRGS